MLSRLARRMLCAASLLGVSGCAVQAAKTGSCGNSGWHSPAPQTAESLQAEMHADIARCEADDARILARIREGAAPVTCWDEAYLRRMRETPLAMGPAAPESVRFLWLRTFDEPIIVRLERQPDGTGLLVARRFHGAGGYYVESLEEEQTRTLSKVSADALMAKVEASGLWGDPPPGQQDEGLDGAQWLLEGVREGRYRSREMWSPGRPDEQLFRDACLALVTASGLTGIGPVY